MTRGRGALQEGGGEELAGGKYERNLTREGTMGA